MSWETRVQRKLETAVAYKQLRQRLIIRFKMNNLSSFFFKGMSYNNQDIVLITFLIIIRIIQRFVVPQG